MLRTPIETWLMLQFNIRSILVRTRNVRKKSLGMCRTVLTTRDHLTTIGEVQQLEKVSGLGEKVLLSYLDGLGNS
jgi:hypothetical protein